MLIIRAWSSASHLSERIRLAMLAKPQANAIIFPGLGVMVLAPSVSSLQRRMTITERLIFLASGRMPATSSCNRKIEGMYEYAISWRIEPVRGFDYLDIIVRAPMLHADNAKAELDGRESMFARYSA